MLRKVLAPSVFCRVLVLSGVLALLLVSAPAEAKEGADPITVTAKLVEIPAKFPPDDLYDYAFVMRYQVTDGALAGKSILVAHYKPRQPRSRIKGPMKEHVGGKLRNFTEGATHKLKLSPDLKAIWKGALIDEFAATDRKSVRYWALEADKA